MIPDDRSPEPRTLASLPPNGGGDEARDLSGLPVLGNRARERVGPHREALFDVDQPQVLPSQAGDLNRLLDRGMRLRGRVRDEPPVGAALVDPEAGRALARSEERAQRRARRRVLEDAASGPIRAEFRRQAEHTDSIRSGAMPVGRSGVVRDDTVWVNAWGARDAALPAVSAPKKARRFHSSGMRSSVTGCLI